MATAPNTFRNLLATEGSVTDGLGSIAEHQLARPSRSAPTTATSATAAVRLRDRCSVPRARTGAKPLNLALHHGRRHEHRPGAPAASERRRDELRAVRRADVRKRRHEPADPAVRPAGRHHEPADRDGDGADSARRRRRRRRPHQRLGDGRTAGGNHGRRTAIAEWRWPDDADRAVAGVQTIGDVTATDAGAISVIRVTVTGGRLCHRCVVQLARDADVRRLPACEPCSDLSRPSRARA